MRRIEKLVQSQKGTLDMFVTTSKNDLDLSKELVIEQPTSNDLNNDEIVNKINNNEDDNNKNTDKVNVGNLFVPNVDTKLRDLSIEKGTIRENDITFPKDEYSKHFSIAFYVKILPKRKKNMKKMVNIFNTNCSKNLFNDEGTRDWKNLSSKLKRHETTNERITNMNAWVDLQVRLSKRKTINKDVQERIC